MTEEIEKVSYSLGINIAQNLKSQGFTDVQMNHLTDGLVASFSGAELKMSENEAGEILNAYFQKAQAKNNEGAIKEGLAFLEKNKSKEGVITLSSGLQYEIIKEGSGDKPTLTSTVTTHYHGTTIDGNVFDSSVQRGQPASFPVNGVITGWTEALQLMAVGSKWRLFVPSDLAYGERGAGQDIGPHATLIFEVELLSID